MTIGEKIKELRRKNDVTQEKLADYLGLSFQSISKWENNAALPDVSYIVPISNFFGITSDELLGNSRDEEFFKERKRKVFELRHKGDVRGTVAVCREVLKQYPNNYEWLSELANELCIVSHNCPGFSKAERKQACTEGIEVCNRIMEDCTDDEIRTSCRQNLVFLYESNGESQKALEEAQKAPNIYLSREVMSDNIGDYADTQTLKRKDSTLLIYLDLFTRSLTRYDANTIRRHETAIAIWNMIIDDGNFLFYHGELSFYHNRLALEYAEAGNREKMYENIEKAVYHAIAVDALPEKQVDYTAEFVKYASYDKTKTITTDTRSWPEVLKDNLLRYPQFEPYRNESKFQEILQNI